MRSTVLRSPFWGPFLASFLGPVSFLWSHFGNILGVRKRSPFWAHICAQGTSESYGACSRLQDESTSIVRSFKTKEQGAGGRKQGVGGRGHRAGGIEHTARGRWQAAGGRRQAAGRQGQEAQSKRQGARTQGRGGSGQGAGAWSPGARSRGHGAEAKKQGAEGRGLFDMDRNARKLMSLNASPHGTGSARPTWMALSACSLAAGSGEARAVGHIYLPRAARGKGQGAGGRRQAAGGTQYVARCTRQAAFGRRLGARGKGQTTGSRRQARTSSGMPRGLPPEGAAMHMWTDLRKPFDGTR